MNNNALSKAKPLLEGLYGDYKVDYNLNKCNEKDTLLKLLKNHTPKCVDKINTGGSYWHIWNKDNDLIRIRLEKYEMDYRRKVIPDVVDITIKKDVFIKEFKQMLDEISRY